MDGARLDEFVFSSGTSTFCKFMDAGALRHCRQMIPVFATAVHQGSMKGETRYESANNDEYMVKMMQDLLPLMRQDGVMSQLSTTQHNSVTMVKIIAHSILGDYPGMCRYVNTRGGRCPFCWYKRGPFGEQSLKTSLQERERLKRCKDDVCTTLVVFVTVVVYS